MFYKKGVLRNFTKFTGKHLCQSIFLSLRPASLLNKRLWHRYFPVNFVKFLGTPLFTEHLWWLLLNLNCLLGFDIFHRDQCSFSKRAVKKCSKNLYLKYSIISKYNNIIQLKYNNFKSPIIQPRPQYKVAQRRIKSFNEVG